MTKKKITSTIEISKTGEVTEYFLSISQNRKVTFSAASEIRNGRPASDFISCHDSLNDYFLSLNEYCTILAEEGCEYISYKISNASVEAMTIELTFIEN